MENGRFKSKFGYELETYKWKPEGTPKVSFFLENLREQMFSSFSTSAMATASGQEITVIRENSFQSFLS